MDKILMDHDDVLVSATIIYANLGSSERYPYAYKDPDCTVPMNRAELEEAFTKGALVRNCYDKAYYVPVAFYPYEGVTFFHWIGAEQCVGNARPYEPDEEEE